MPSAGHEGLVQLRTPLAGWRCQRELRECVCVCVCVSEGWEGLKSRPDTDSAQEMLSVVHFSGVAGVPEISTKNS